MEEVTKDFKTLVKEYCKDRQNPSPGQELIYLGEVQDKCPKCGKPLLHQGTKKVNKNFEIYEWHEGELVLREQVNEILLSNYRDLRTYSVY